MDGSIWHPTLYHVQMFAAACVSNAISTRAHRECAPHSACMDCRRRRGRTWTISVPPAIWGLSPGRAGSARTADIPLMQSPLCL
ncbi:hypothetical protein PBRA_003823 [Plasmodiophora brassicae]|uniref:Uncharacterized protein n=1 Tax=Plasmodiophora brassicae TaxID=37360 RepID=A0A0G4IIR1_PLABS|nr:hypothetical protein PBRA_003823 [Plasmodiophora brassicae]